MVVSECHSYRLEAYNGWEFNLGKQVGVREVFLVTFNHSSHKDLPSNGRGIAGIWGVKLQMLGDQEK